MLKAAIISMEEAVSERLTELVTDTGAVSIVRSMSSYPSGHELVRVIRAYAPQVLLINVEQLGRALEAAAVAEQNFPGIQIIAVGREAAPQQLMELMRAGIREFVPYPFQRQVLYDALVRVKEILARKPVHDDVSQHVYTFLPAKPGVGTTTIATNTAVALSRMPDRRSLLIDCDQNSGMVRFLLQLGSSYSILDAAERALQLDEHVWPQLITSIGNLDVMHSGRPNPAVRIEPAHLRHILEYARRNYRGVFLDVSGNFERYSMEAMQESRKIFLVVTPEVSSLHLAREKLKYLGECGLMDRLEVLVNRTQKRPLIGVEQIEELLGLKVAMTFWNSYAQVQRAYTEGKPVESDSELGRQFQQFAYQLVDHKPVVEKKKGLSEYFSLIPGGVGLFQQGKKPAS